MILESRPGMENALERADRGSGTPETQKKRKSVRWTSLQLCWMLYDFRYHFGCLLGAQNAFKFHGDSLWTLDFGRLGWPSWLTFGGSGKPSQNRRCCKSQGLATGRLVVPKGQSPKLTRFPQAHSNGVVLCSLCPPRRWSGGGGNQNVEGDLLTFG